MIWFILPQRVTRQMNPPHVTLQRLITPLDFFLIGLFSSFLALDVKVFYSTSGDECSVCVTCPHGVKQRFVLMHMTQGVSPPEGKLH